MKTASLLYGARLTVREHEVHNLITAGLSSKQVAERLCISEYTVANHRKSILGKKGAKDFKELVR